MRGWGGLDEEDGGESHVEPEHQRVGARVLIQGLGFRSQGLGFRSQGLGFRVLGLEFRF